MYAKFVSTECRKKGKTSSSVGHQRKLFFSLCLDFVSLFFIFKYVIIIKLAQSSISGTDMINTITRSPRVKFLAKILDYIFGVGTSTAREFDQYRSLSCGGIFKIRWRTICFIFMIKIADTYRNINRGHMEQVADGLIDPKIPYIFNITKVNGTTIISEIPKIHTFLQLVWGCKIPSQQQPMWSTRTGHYKSIQDHSPCNTYIQIPIYRIYCVSTVYVHVRLIKICT